MNWSDLLKSEIEREYRIAADLIGRVSDDQLDWQPPIGPNWMTMRQLLAHLVTSGAAVFKGFITGQWEQPSEETPIQSVAQAQEMLSADKQQVLELLAQCGEDRLANEPCPAPWNPTPMILGHRLLSMVQHFSQHKGQLFYYLKMQGQPVGTRELWG